MSRALGIDIGGTKIAVCRLDDDLAPTATEKVPTALLRRGTVRFADDLAVLIRSRLTPGVAAVGVSLNGVLSGQQVVWSSLMGGRVDFPFGDYLSQHVGLPVHVDDDIHAMTVAEAELGAGRDGRPFAMLNLGTGIGVGCYDGGVLRGAFAAGLIAELPVSVPAMGGWRSLDRTVCGRGIREMYLERTGRAVDAVGVFRRADAGEEAAAAVVDIFAQQLGAVLQMVSKFYHPVRIVLNGSIALAASQFLPRALSVYRSGLDEIFLGEVTVSTVAHAAERGTVLQSAGRRG
ncbi:ROK family protein [Nakamurella endophytica]|uniref:Sugar kinase n=1 Tax=Nakamurella endophytica TaxID=1748367 RepID=A0A917TBI4_9ACTN|nr:ROK family protein [Nakamurella endophytica]GGM14536.1 sugar kinase [Nakamurella endophytica]